MPRDSRGQGRQGRSADRSGTLRILAPWLGPNLTGIRVGVVLAVVGQALLALLPLVQQVIIDDTILSDRRSLSAWIAVFVAVATVAFAVQYLRRRVSFTYAARSQRDLQRAVHHHMQHLDSSGRDRFRTGDVMSRATGDLTLIQMYLQQLGIAWGNVTLLATALIGMFLLSPLLALAMAVVIPFFLVVTFRFRSRVFPASWTDQLYKAAVAGVVEEAVTGVRVVKAFGQEAQEEAALRSKARLLFQSRLRNARINAFFAASLDAFPGATQLAVLAFGGWLAMRGDVSLGVLAAFASYVLQLVTPVRFMANIVAISQQARGAATRVLELLRTTSTVAERPDARVLTDAVGRIDVDHVDFAFDGGEAVLHDITLHIEPGERVAVVGASGSGKSTLALLLARFHDPTAGTVKLDDVDLRAFTLDSLRASVGLVFEEGFLFNTTIAENIAFGRPGAAGDDIEQAATVAQAHDFIAGMPDGYATVVGERGFTLSGGQRQRIALARAALTGARVLVLDDATSAIDARTEHAIHDSLDEVLGRRTTILIAKRPSTLQLADRVIVLDRGRIVDQGSTDELLQRSELFRELLAGPDVDAVVPPVEVVDEVDPAAWPEGVSREGAAKASGLASALAVAGAGTSMGGGHDQGRVASLASLSSSLQHAVDRLPPLSGEPRVDLDGMPAPAGPLRMRDLVAPFSGPLLLASVLVVFDAVSGLAAPALIRFGVDHGVVAQSRRVLMIVTVVLAVLQCLIWVNQRAMIRLTQSTAERMLFGLRNRTFAHLQRLSLDYFEQHQAGQIMTRMTSDIEAFATLFQQGLVTALVSLLSCFGIAIVLAVFDPGLALLVSVALIPLVIATYLFRRASARVYLIARQRISILYADMQESLSGVLVSQAYSRQSVNEARFAHLSESYYEARSRSFELMARFFPFVDFIAAIAKALALVFGAQRIAAGDLTSGVLIAFLLYVDLFFAPIRQLSLVFDQWLQANVALNQLRELLGTPSRTPVAADPVVPSRIRGEIGLDHVSFAYASTGLTAMNDVTLTIPAGQVVALVGTTGAGKSTLMKLIARFHDATDGVLTIDGTPLESLDLAAYRHQLGFVPQEPFLFSGTIRSNIAYGRSSASDLEVERAARAVGAHDFIAGLPQGYLTPVSEQGRSLSAGQRQLLSLARALLVDPAILLLDEATANLDLATEAGVQRAMGLVASGRTTILIAHRLQTARVAHRILVVDDGAIAEDGTHEELLALGGRYADLWSVMTRHRVGV